MLAILVAACSSAVPSPSPTAGPTPVVTPDPHLTGAATGEQVFTGLGRAGLRMTPHSASTFDNDASPVVMRINATYVDWPLDLFQFRTPEDLAAATAKWPDEKGPGKGDPPVSIVGQNILVTWGPRTTGRAPDAPDARQAEGLRALVAALELLLSPLRAHAVVPIELAVAPIASEPAAPSSAAPSKKPKATPAP